MKSQDIFLLFKLISLERAYQDDSPNQVGEAAVPYLDPYSARGLAASLGLSKSEANASLNRSISVGMALIDRNSGIPKVNKKALLDFVEYGLKYVFSAKLSQLARGIPTAFSAPPLKEELLSAGEFGYVWPDAEGEEMGQSVTPLFHSVPEAVRKDPLLYEYLALADAVRLGNPRESKLAIKLLKERT